MKKLFFRFMFVMASATALAYTPPAIVFNTPSANDRGAMLLGDGEVGAMAWVTADGTLHTYLQRSDSWNEVGEHVKVGGIDYVSSCPVDAGTFRQEMSLEHGEFSATWKSGGRPVSVSYRVQWGDAHLAVCAFDGAPEVVATNVNWRLFPGGVREFTAKELRRTVNFSYTEDAGFKQTFAVSADRLLAGYPPVLSGWCHVNRNSTVDQLLAFYDYTQATADLGKPDLLHNRCFGAITRTEKGVSGKTLFLSAITCFQPCAGEGEWTQRTCEVLSGKGWKLADEPARRAAHWAGWRSFWDRSHIEISPRSNDGKRTLFELPQNRKLPFAFGVSSDRQFPLKGACTKAELAFDGKVVFTGVPKAGDVLAPAPANVKNALRFDCEFTLSTTKPPQRLLDNITSGGPDGLLVDVLNGRLRVILGRRTLRHATKMVAGQPTTVAVEISPYGEVSATVNGVREDYPGPQATLAEECKAVNLAWAAQRFMTRCAGTGQLPIRFNGSLFLMNEKGNPDYRPWGHGFWWQNTRLPYYPLFAAGDLEMLDPLFRLYNYNLLEFLKRRTRRYLKHGGAFFPECMQPWGDHFVGCYGTRAFKDRTDKLQESGWHKYEWVGQLELSLMMLDYAAYQDDPVWFKDRALPAIREFVRYFDEHYRLAADGHYDWQPSQATETWWQCTDSMPEVAGLTRITERLLALPSEVVGAEDRALFTRIRARIPELPTRPLKDGRCAFAPARKYAKKCNCEHPEMYCIFPFRLCSFEKPNAEQGRATYEVRTDRLFHGWSQEELFACYLGMTEEARKHFVNRVLTHVQKKFRWPAYWGPNFNCCPDGDEGANVQNTLQSMLMQVDGDKIFLLPAWPKDWNGSFKLHAPHRTVLEGRIENGQVKDLVVTPASRRADVQIKSL